MKRISFCLVMFGLLLAGCSSPTSPLSDNEKTFALESQEGLFLSKGGATAFGDSQGTASEACNEANFRPYTYALWAGQSNDAGTVTISTDGTSLLVTYDTNETADLKEVHVNVYTDELDVPSKRPAPGRAPYKAENLYVDSYTVTIPLSDLGVDPAAICDQTFYLIAHAALTGDETGNDDNAGETAYSGGNDSPGKGAWFYISEYDNFCDCQTDDCVAEGDLLAGQYNDIGTITVSEDGDDLLISYEIDWINPDTNEPYPLGELAIYVFTDPSELTGGRPNPGQAPYKVSTDELNGASSYSVRIPLSDFGDACPLYIVAKTTVNGETTYGGILGETGVNVGAPGPWWYYLTLDCCA